MTAPRDYVDRATDYCRGVVAGIVPACTLTQLACRRQLEDLERAAQGDPDFPYAFDRAAGNAICGWVEEFPHVKGRWAKAKNPADRLIRVEDWQCFILSAAFGWLHEDTGLRRFQTVYIEVPRKNAKTTLSAPVALFMLGPDGEPGAECVAAATKKEQAKIAFNIAKTMVRKTEEFRTEYAVQTRVGSITCLENESSFMPIDSRGATQDGANLHFSLNDELHAWKGRELYGVLDTAMGSRDQPMMWNITTAGSDSSGICYETRSYLVNLLQGHHADETFFGVIYTIDEGDDLYAEATHRKANPNYGVSVLVADIERLANKARHNAKSRIEFKTKRLNVWVGAAQPFFDLEAWDACADPTIREIDFAGLACTAGLDLAAKRDINAGVRRFQEPGDKGLVTLLFDFWLPQARIDEVDNPSYPGWAEEGHLKVTDGNVVDYTAIKDRVGEWAALHDLTEMGFDPYQATHMVRLLMDENIVCVEVRATVLNFSEPMKELDKLIAEGRLRHDGNPVMRWMMGNVVAVRDHKDNVYPRKERQENKIDGPVAAIMAQARAAAYEEAAPVPQIIVLKGGGDGSAKAAGAP